MGIVQNLFLKPASGEPMRSCQTLQLVAREGAEGDAGRCAASPRQLLLLGEDSRTWLGLEPGEARENVLIGGLDPRSLQSGALVHLGSGGATVRITMECEPCGKLQPVLRRGRSLKDAAGGRRGMLATVVSGGRVGAGDRVEAKAGVFESFPEKPEQRFHRILSRVPPGRVVTYLDLVTMLGVFQSSVRVFPMYLKRAPAGLPAHRLVDSAGGLVRHVPGQRGLLEAEGVAVQAAAPPRGKAASSSASSAQGVACEAVDLERFRWRVGGAEHEDLFCRRAD